MVESTQSKSDTNMESAPEQVKLLIVSKKLGDGAEANVYEAHYEGDDNLLAVKVYKMASLRKRVDAPEKEY